MRLSVIIPTFNRKEKLKNLLEQLTVFKKKCDFSIIVVNAGSTDGTGQMLDRDYSTVHEVTGTDAWWYTRCMNEGFKYAENQGATHVLTLNDDVVLYDDYFYCLFNAVEQVGDNCIINSLTLTNNAPYKVIFSGVKEYIKWRGKMVRYIAPFTEVSEEKLTGIYPTWIISGRGIFIPMRLLTELNYFDERFPQYGSDDSFGLSAIAAGYKVYVSWDMKILEDTKTTSKGVAYNRDGLIQFIRSFFNPHSVNSLKKTYYYARKHNLQFPFLIPVNMLISILGTSYAYLFKYRRIKNGK